MSNGVARKKKAGCIPCVKPIVARTTATVDRLKRMFFEDVKVIGLQVGGRKKRGGVKLIYMLDGVYLFVSVDLVRNELILVQVNDGDSEACTLNAVNRKQ